MKKVIGKKLFDTEKSELIHQYSNGFPVGDFEHYSESLYQTKNGRLFIHGYGGAKSKYSRQHGNSISSGENIYLLDDEYEAVRWLERHNGTEALLSYFGSLIEEG